MTQTKSASLAVVAALALACASCAPAGTSSDGDPHATGYRPPTAAEQVWADEHFVHTTSVRLNQLALDRLNAEREALGTAPLTREAAAVVADGHEMLGHLLDPLAEQATLEQGLSLATAPSTLPRQVDNSVLKYFPPIRSQGSLNSCVAFSTIYYTLTFMHARANDWDVRSDDSKQMSPKFTANLQNLGGGTSTNSMVVRVAQTHGMATWADLPYDSDGVSWPTTAALWRGALHHRASASGYIKGVDNEIGLNQLKAMLADGYLLNFATGAPDIEWRKAPLDNDPATPNDDALAGQLVGSSLLGNGSHAMTVVGYNDDLWYDFNGNGIVEPAEKGALKVANSWGASWANAGFIWLAYDALKPKTAVSGWVSPSPRLTGFWLNEAIWTTVRSSGYNPTMVANCSLTHGRRNQLAVAFGHGAGGAAAPEATSPVSVFVMGASLPFSGNMLFDVSDLAAAGANRWFMSFADNSGDGVGGSLQSCQLEDASGALLANLSMTVPDGGYPLSFDGNTVLVAADLTVTDSTKPAAVSDLTASPAPTSVKLWWTAPGDDGSSGIAQSYSLRYSTSPITLANWASATVVATGVPAPGSGGALQTADVASLTPGGTYSFAVLATDEAGNTGAMSNSVQVTLPTALAISTGTALPNAPLSQLYSNTITAAGGTPPYRWATAKGYAEDTSGSGSLITGTPMNWKGTNTQWLYAYPGGFTFSFCGIDTSMMFVSSSGTLQFPEVSSTYTLNMMAPFWSGLAITADDEDIFTESAADHLTIRWRAHSAAEPTADGTINFQVTLFANGTFRYDYGDTGTQTAFIGTNVLGAPNDWSMASSLSFATLTAGTTVLFAPSQLPAGLSIDPTTGVLSGTPTVGGGHQFKVAVTDDAHVAVTQRKVKSFSLRVGTGPASPPAIASAASASLNPVVGVSTVLSVLGADDSGEAALRYTWSVSPNLGSVSFGANASNAAKVSTATFTQPGTYTFDVEIRDAGGLTVHSAVLVTVNRALTRIDVTPLAANVLAVTTQQLSAQGFDQFGQAMTTGATAWAINGGGTLSSTGLFTAGSSPGGPFIASATAAGVTGTAAVTVTSPNGPTIASARATPASLSATTTQLAVVATDDGGEAALTYTWSTLSGPAPVTFAPNGNNAAKNAVATFGRAGAYQLLVTVTDATAASSTAAVLVAVAPTATALMVIPAMAQVVVLTSRSFAVELVDQFGDTMVTQVVVAWSASGGGTVDSTGLFAAGAVAGGPHQLTAVEGGLSGNGEIWVVSAGQDPGSMPGSDGGTSTVIGDGGAGGSSPTSRVPPQVITGYCGCGAGSGASASVFAAIAFALLRRGRRGAEARGA